MQPASQSNREKPKKKLKSVPKPTQQKRNWLELPSDVMANILFRVGVYDILENAQKVCTTWCNICKDPAMWRVIHMDNIFKDVNRNGRSLMQEMCKHAVDRSNGQLVDLTVVDFADDELLKYIADRSSQLRRLEFACSYGAVYDSWPEALIKFPLLEELNLYFADISKEAIETAGRCCPMLRTLKIYKRTPHARFCVDEIALAIGGNLPELRHLELIGDGMSSTGLQVILDGCCQLESLDLHQCWSINLEGHLGKICPKNIKCLKLPNDTLEDFHYDYSDDDDEYDWYSDYDVYTSPRGFGFYDDVEDFYLY